MVKSKKIIIATHFLMYGAAHALRDYLNLKKVNHLLFIGLPFHSQREVIVEEYKKGKNVKLQSTTRTKSHEIINYIKDLLEITSLLIRRKEKFDTFIGVDNLNCLAGIVLKKMNKVNRVVYYSIDFVPIRFPNKIINQIYHYIEAVAVRYSDEVWDVSPRIAEGRKKFLRLEYSAKKHIVPIGVWKIKSSRKPLNINNKHKIVFIGHVLEKQGIQEVIKAIPFVIKAIPDFSFEIIGEGEYITSLKAKVMKMNLEKHVRFLGVIKNRDSVDKALSEYSFAVATYKPEKEKLHNFSYYADPTKIKDYLSNGLPIILTDIPYNASDLQKKECAIVVEYDATQIANAIKSLMLNSKKLRLYRLNALNLSRSFKWENIFTKLTI